MNKQIFEELRSSKNKSIKDGVSLRPSDRSSSTLEARNIVIENELGFYVHITIRYNKETEAKTINITVKDIGPICRLDVDGQEHRPVGRHHKHDFKTIECPSRNIPHAIARPELAGKNIQEIFEIFCKDALIAHSGLELE